MPQGFRTVEFHGRKVCAQAMPCAQPSRGSVVLDRSLHQCEHPMLLLQRLRVLLPSVLLAQPVVALSLPARLPLSTPAEASTKANLVAAS